MNKEERIAKVKKLMAEERERTQAKIREYWENLPHFERPNQVPKLPHAVEKAWREYYVPKLIAAGAIPKDQLKDGEHYYGSHRIAQYARWNASSGIFEYWRHKFGTIFIDHCNHFEDDDGFSLFVPIATATKEQFDRTSIPTSAQG